MSNKQIDKHAFYLISSGVYIVSTSCEGYLNGQVVNTVMQVSGDPEICVVTALHKDNYTTELVMKSRMFSVGVLEEEVPMPFIGNFGFRCGREHDKFSNCNYEMYDGSLPIIKDHTLAAFCADVIAVQEVKTHYLFTGHIKHAEVLKQGNPLTYKAYHELKKGKSPRNAPSSVFNDQQGLNDIPG